MKKSLWPLPAMALSLVLGTASARSANDSGGQAEPSPGQARTTDQVVAQERLTEREQLQHEPQPGQLEQREQLSSGNPPDDPGQGLKPGKGSKEAADKNEIREGPYGDRQKPSKSGKPRH